MSKLRLPVLLATLTSLCFSQTGTKIDANTQIRNWRYTPTNGASPIGVPNLYTYDNHAIIQNLINLANASGLCQVYLPPGIWYTSAGFDVPTCVEISGVGFGQGTTFAPTGPTLGTVVQAMPSFTGPTNYPSHFMLYVDGSTTVGSEADTYNVNVHNITFDCAGVAGCSGFYIGHANEFVSVHDDVFANFADFGEYHCGAGLGEPSGLPWQYCGDNGSGPYYNNQLVSYGDWVTSHTYPLVVMSSLGNKPWSNYTINTTEGPINAVTVQGLDLGFSSFHVQNSTNAFLLGDTSGGGLCDTLPGGRKCLGLQVATLDHISLGPTGAGYVIVNENSLSTKLTAIRSDGQTVAVLDDVHNSKTTPNLYLGEYYLQDTTGDCFAVEYCGNFHTQIYTDHNLLVQGTAPAITTKYAAGAFPFHTIQEDAAGELTIGGSGGTRNVLFTDGWAVLSARSGSSTSFNGANMQSPLLADGSIAEVNAVFGSNVYWDVASTAWRFGNLGGAGFSALWGSRYGGMGITASNAGQPGTVSDAQFLINTSLWAKENGHILMAPPGSGGAYNAADSGSELTVIGGIAGALTGNASTASAFDHTPTPCGTWFAVNGVTATGQGNGGGGCLPVDREWVSSGSCSTAGAAGSTCTTTLTWPSAYGTTGYFAACSLMGPFTGAPYLEGVTKISGAQVQVTISNGQGSQAVVSAANSIECSGRNIP